LGFVGSLKKEPSPPIGFPAARANLQKLRLQFLPNGVMDCHDRSPVQEKLMSTKPIEAQETPATEASPAKRKPSVKKAKPAKTSRRAKKPANKPKADRANKKAEVIALMKRAKGATLAEIMAATGWQAHTVRGFVSILGSKEGEKIESSKSDAGERTYKIAK
jgi:hypothetical protein